MPVSCSVSYCCCVRSWCASRAASKPIFAAASRQPRHRHRYRFGGVATAIADGEQLTACQVRVALVGVLEAGGHPSGQRRAIDVADVLHGLGAERHLRGDECAELLAAAELLEQLDAERVGIGIDVAVLDELPGCSAASASPRARSRPACSRARKGRRARRDRARRLAPGRTNSSSRTTAPACGDTGRCMKIAASSR